LKGFFFQSFYKVDDLVAFEKAMSIRNTVFVQEQNVPLDEERDEYDETALHFLGLSVETGQAVATARIIPYREASHTQESGKIGRVAVLKSLRGCGLGLQAMQAILADPLVRHYPHLILDAQTHALGFYEKLGFIREGSEFLDAGIPHYRMRRTFL
jgi:predicted GNAT family N-acyltransferase